MNRKREYLFYRGGRSRGRGGSGRSSSPVQPPVWLGFRHQDFAYKELFFYLMKVMSWSNKSNIFSQYAICGNNSTWLIGTNRKRKRDIWMRERERGKGGGLETTNFFFLSPRTFENRAGRYIEPFKKKRQEEVTSTCLYLFLAKGEAPDLRPHPLDPPMWWRLSTRKVYNISFLDRKEVFPRENLNLWENITLFSSQQKC